jgi:hypothetical protein
VQGWPAIAWPKPVIEYFDINSILSLVCRVGRPNALRTGSAVETISVVGRLRVVETKKDLQENLLVRSPRFRGRGDIQILRERNRPFSKLFLRLKIRTLSRFCSLRSTQANSCLHDMGLRSPKPATQPKAMRSKP